MTETANAPISAAADDDTTPLPPRYWWLKRLGLVQAALLLALGGLHWWWSHAAATRLAARIAAIEAAGEPIFPAEFSRPTTDPAGAAEPLNRAFAAIVSEVKLKPRGKLSLGDAEYAEVRAARPADVDRLLAANRTALDALHEARQFDDANWNLSIASPMSFTLLPTLSTTRVLGRVARLDAETAHRDGRDGAALERVRDTLHLTRSLQRPPAFLITHFVALAVNANVCNLLEIMTPTLRIADCGQEHPADGEATRAQVLALMADLLDETQFARSAQDAADAERASVLDGAQFVIGGRGAAIGLGGIPSWLVALERPAFQLEALRMLHWMSQTRAAFVAPNWPAAKLLLPAAGIAASGVEGLAREMSNNLLPSLGGAIKLHFRGMRARRMAAIALALRLYEVEQGKPASSLAALVPEYLARLPSDPFAVDGRSFGYLPNAEQPRLYSIGEDGIDDRGEFALRIPGGIDLDKADFPFFLRGDTPTAALTESLEKLLGLVGEAGDENADVGDDGRGTDDEVQE